MFKLFRKRMTIEELDKKAKLAATAELVSIPKMSDPELSEDFQQSLEEFAQGIDAKWSFHPADYGDATMVATTRDYIHILVKEADNRHVSLDIQRLRQLDTIWQKWCLERIKIDLQGKNRYSSGTMPKTEWWWWIDRLDELTEEERSTLQLATARPTTYLWRQR